MQYGQYGRSGSLGTEVEMLKSAVARYFDVYDIRVTYDAVAFFVKCEPSTLEEKFDNLRLDLVPRNYVPFIRKRGAEYAIIIGKRKPIGRKGNLANIILLCVTLVSTTITGAILWSNYYRLPELFTPSTILNGIVFFVFPLMLILGSHEMGHFVVARRYRVNASLPYFLPSIPPLGTLGAFISIRDPFPNRKALLEIGIAGPIVGFLVSIPVAIVGFMLTQVNLVHVIVAPGAPVFKAPFLYNLMMSFFPFSSGSYIIFPTAFAAWVGFFATALNLLPAGQLDGGHVARALLGDNSRYLAWATLIVMIILSLFFTSWILIALFVMILGVRHPPPLNDISKLRVNRKMLGAVAAAMFLISFTPIPVTTNPANPSFMMTSTANTVSVNNSTAQSFVLTLTNTGNMAENITVSVQQNTSGSAYFETLFALSSNASNSSSFSPVLRVHVRLGDTANVTVKIFEINPKLQPPAPGTYIVTIVGNSNGYVRAYSVSVVAS
ncbi:MAG: site-2 protease family protein [Thermoplasmata archaeon]|uniref:Site-2 protease family protein n=1 Tax=Candidatus Sysuiplasma superficiale TaxID=2823368 RepID=A0A8J8CFG6_9ARCH|nr:site-2 protease family protein [Candidatus Sysuiplasma superficiale]MBX8643391.1 site-2 protease family protein [Candidatus Sysuiplasma superficiale]MCL4346775.1 site-2 protease family protein [Candidatus Thermoplasmatota archaeon]MCL5437436.1 site-2 protease family protein [Candidatus Thermoplasmatota archaeon]